MEDRIDLVDGSFWGRNPHDELRWLRENAPVWHDPRSDVWGVASYDLVREVSSNPALYSNAGGIRPDSPPGLMMIDMDDPDHLKRRRLVNRGFTPARVREQEDLIRSTAISLLDAVEERETFDLVWDLAAWLPLIVIGDALGIAPPDREQLLQWSDDLLCALGSGDPAALPKALLASIGYHEYASKVIRARRENPTGDLMSVLAHAEVDGERLDDEEIVTESLLILIGGDETTRHVISGGAYQLLVDRTRWETLLHEPDLVDTAVEEMLRWVSPIKNMARTTTDDVTLGGVQIPAGAKLLLLYPSANRDASAFPDPDVFDLRRSPNDHVAFGFGTHFCLGASLARLELRVLFQELLARLPDLELVDPTEPAYRPANFVSGFESLLVRRTG